MTFLNSINELNNSKYFAGIMILLLNLGSRFITMELSENQEQLLSNKIIRRFVIFTILFVATKDIYVSIVLTAGFIILVSGLFNENSDYCIVTKPVIKQVSEEDYNQALKIVKLFQMQKNN